MSRLNAPSVLSPGQPPPPPEYRRSRIVRYFAENAWLHLTLITMAVVFLFPFAWMIGMSLKTDAEATSTSLFPTVPTFRAASPFVRPAENIVRPADVTSDHWKTLEPTIKHHIRALVQQLPIPASASSVDAEALRDATTQTLTARAIERIDRTTWEKDDEAVATAVIAAIGTDEPAALLDEQLGQLKLFMLQVRSLDGRMFSGKRDDASARSVGILPTPLSTGRGQDAHATNAPETFACKWTIESGDAHLVPASDCDVLQYKFNSGSDAPVVLKADFPFPISIDDMHRLILSIQNDDSWHRIDAELSVDGQTWKSDMSYYVAQFRSGALTLQPNGRLESEYAAKTWVSMSLAPMAEKTAGPHAATLRLTLRPSSTAMAIYGKVLRNYIRAFQAVPFWLYVRNSVVLVVMQLMGALFSSAFVAYAFARLNWPGRSIAFGLLLSTMMLPSQITMIPGFLIWKYLGLYNSLTPLWFGAWLGNAFFIFLMTQNMKTIPKELDEAAKIDGLNSVQTWWYIIVPQVKPTLAAIAITTFMGAWNEFMGPLIMLRDQGKFPLSLGLFGMKVDTTVDWTILMAGNIMMVLPVVLIFFCFQRYFVEGVASSGVKG